MPAVCGGLVRAGGAEGVARSSGGVARSSGGVARSSEGGAWQVPKHCIVPWVKPFHSIGNKIKPVQISCYKNNFW